jgi:hypothetical protein
MESMPTGYRATRRAQRVSGTARVFSLLLRDRTPLARGSNWTVPYAYAPTVAIGTSNDALEISEPVDVSAPKVVNGTKTTGAESDIKLATSLPSAPELANRPLAEAPAPGHVAGNHCRECRLLPDLPAMNLFEATTIDG